MQEIIQDYDEKGMGIAGPRSGRRSRRKGSRLAGDGTSPDVRADDSFDELRCGNVHDLQGNFLDVGQVGDCHRKSFTVCSDDSRDL